MSSRIIKIYRRPNNTRLPEEAYAGSKRKLGSYFGPNGRVITGLTPDEENKLLPLVLNMPSEHVNFLDAKERYYNELTLNVPIDGVELEIGKDEKGMPLNVRNYIEYAFVKNHPWVAQDKAGLVNPSLKFYLHDEKKAIMEKTGQIKDKKLAYKEFMKVSSDANKVNLVLTLLGQETSKMAEEEKEILLEDIASNDPKRFYDIATDKKLEIKAFILECISAEVIQRFGTVIVDGDTKLGDSIDEVAIKLEDKANSDLLTRLKARLQQFKK